ncbi:MoxR family ATPase [Kineosporia sp. NBRC 101731]|uniref:AAA family ATPase n=1 Tax=Kineosporia sp. NBRC 101731 TaxID=3032199 RepID=UPI0024A2A434|nr:MoxR family ATPase [Kineosporia sp. NBRC 101731]GLY29093.1 MoxR-like ATPase [Kineosporia sp. NBRC 101731]
MSELAEIAGKIRSSVERALQGKPEQVRLAVIALLSEGHLLVEDVPGVGKTTLARAMAATVEGRWQRVQFTPDLLPSDVTGITVYHQQAQKFEFRPGPVFANIVLADEINRASPKTQSALLEVMEERHVTVDGRQYPVPRPFVVVATQNPVEMDGTFRLPEAQLDRFMMRISIGYPQAETESQMLRHEANGPTVESIRPVVTLETVQQMIQHITRLHVADEVRDYIVAVTGATRSLPEARIGASPRASLALLRASRTSAAVDGRDFVTADDVKTMASAVLSHRLILTPQAEMAGVTQADLVDRVISGLPTPTSRAAGAGSRRW